MRRHRRGLMAAPDDDPHNLQRFVAAQVEAYAAALGVLHAGRKRTHWMWFVFPQVGGLRELSNGRVIVADARDKIVSFVDLASGSAEKVGGTWSMVKNPNTA